MPDPTNDIDSLIRYLDYLVGCDPQWARAVRALVAERDALKQRVAELDAQQPPTSDLRDLCGDPNSDLDGEALAAMRKGESDGK